MDQLCTDSRGCKERATHRIAFEHCQYFNCRGHDYCDFHTDMELAINDQVAHIVRFDHV